MPIQILPTPSATASSSLYFTDIVAGSTYNTADANAVGSYQITIEGNNPRRRATLSLVLAAGRERFTIEGNEVYTSNSAFSAVEVVEATLGTKMRIVQGPNSAITATGTAALVASDTALGAINSFWHYANSTSPAYGDSTSGQSWQAICPTYDGTGYYAINSSGTFRLYSDFQSTSFTARATHSLTSSIVRRSLYDVDTHVLCFSYYNSAIIPKVHAYNKSSNTWTQVATPFSAAGYSTIVTTLPQSHFIYNNRLYPMVEDPGYYYDGNASWARTAISTPTDSGWYSQGSGAYMATSAKYLASQRNGQATSTNGRYQVYNVATNTWAFTATDPGGSARFRGATLFRNSGTTVLAMGRGFNNGSTMESDSSAMVDVIYQYDGATDTWSAPTMTDALRTKWSTMLGAAWNDNSYMTQCSPQPFSLTNHTDMKFYYHVTPNNQSSSYQLPRLSVVNLAHPYTLSRIATHGAKPLRVIGEKHILGTGVLQDATGSSPTQTANGTLWARADFNSTTAIRKGDDLPRPVFSDWQILDMCFTDGFFFIRGWERQVRTITSVTSGSGSPVTNYRRFHARVNDIDLSWQYDWTQEWNTETYYSTDNDFATNNSTPYKVSWPRPFAVDPKVDLYVKFMFGSSSYPWHWEVNRWSANSNVYVGASGYNGFSSTTITSTLGNSYYQIAGTYSSGYMQTGYAIQPFQFAGWKSQTTNLGTAMRNMRAPLFWDGNRLIDPFSPGIANYSGGAALAASNPTLIYQVSGHHSYYGRYASNSYVINAPFCSYIDPDTGWGIFETEQGFYRFNINTPSTAGQGRLLSSPTPATPTDSEASYAPYYGYQNRNSSNTSYLNSTQQNGAHLGVDWFRAAFLDGSTQYFMGAKWSPRFFAGSYDYHSAIEVPVWFKASATV
jgi:hypothetical protein